MNEFHGPYADEVFTLLAAHSEEHCTGKAQKPPRKDTTNIKYLDVTVATEYLCNISNPDFTSDSPELRRQRIQALLFYVDATVCALRGHKLFRENPIARLHGPVYAGAIQSLHNRYHNTPTPVSIDITAPATPPTPLPRHRVVMDAVRNTLQVAPTAKLISWTHKELPWAVSEKEGEIFEALMLDWFADQAAQGEHPLCAILHEIDASLAAQPGEPESEPEATRDS